jgi:predicted acetyltransferase
MSFDYGTLESRDLESVLELQAEAFAVTKEDVPAWLARAGHDNVRVLRSGGVPLASLILVPMAHLIEGREVPCIGIAGVGVALQARGTGAGRELMSRCVREIHGHGVAISSLFPATQSLYRKVGYERAGKLVEYSVERDALAELPRVPDVEVRPLSRAEQPAIEELIARVSTSESGALVRGPYLWNRLWNRLRSPASADGAGNTSGRRDELPRSASPAARAFGFFRGAELVAHLFMVQEPDPEHAPMHLVRVLDFSFDSREGALALLGFLHAQRSLATGYVLRGGPSMKLLHLLAEPRWEERSVLDWMVRMTNVEQALEARGWAPGAAGEIVLDVHDDLLDQSGRYSLTVEGGRGRVHRGDTSESRAPAIALDVRALAPLFTGHLTAPELAHLGLLESRSDEALRVLGELFRTGRPWVNEMF